LRHTKLSTFRGFLKYAAIEKQNEKINKPAELFHQPITRRRYSSDSGHNLHVTKKLQ
jgi:hypothetical protein